MKIAINTDYGGFSLSQKALTRLEELGYKRKTDSPYIDIERDHPLLIQVIEELGFEVNRWFSAIKVIEIPDEYKDKWHIEEYDGSEWVAENHKTWKPI